MESTLKKGDKVKMRDTQGSYMYGGQLFTAAEDSHKNCYGHEVVRLIEFNNSSCFVDYLDKQ
jgi:hypothetical protein